jgi:hypothetical protein
MTLTVPLLIALGVMALLTAGARPCGSSAASGCVYWAERCLRGSVAVAVTYLERPHRLLTAAERASRWRSSSPACRSA